MDTLFPESRILTTNMLVDLINESNGYKERFCFILGSGASVESGIPSGNELEKRWMECITGVSADGDAAPKNIDEVRKYAEKLKNEKKISHDFSEIENEWEKNKHKYLSSEYYFDLFKLRFYPNHRNGYRYMEKVMESAQPSIGYHTLAKLLTDENKNNLVITTNFDSMVEDSLFLYTDQRPLVINHELLADYINESTVRRPVIAKIHRGLFFDPLNSQEETNKLKKEWSNALSSVFKIYTPIVIGYGGGDHSLMDYLEDENVYMQNGIYWCYCSKYGLPNIRILELVNRRGGYLVQIDGFDSLMLSFGKKIYSEEILPEPTANLLKQRCDARIMKYIDQWENLDGNVTAVKDLKDLERTTEAEREQTVGLSSLGLLIKGNRYFNESKFDQAIECYNKAIEFDSNFETAYNNRGNTYVSLNHYDKAISDYNKAIELNPEYYKGYNNRGSVFGILNQCDKAISDYNKAIELNPKCSEAYNNRGNAYNSLNLCDKAIADYNKAIELNPEYTEAYNNRGTAYASRNQYDKAIADYNKAIELNLTYPKAYNNRGNAYVSLNKYDKAISDYNKAIELNPKYTEAYNNRGIVYSSLNQYDKAISDYNKAIELNPKYTEAYDNRGTVYGSLNQYDKAISDYNKAIELNPEYTEAYNNRGTAYASRNQYDKAISDYNKAIELNPKCSEAYNNRGTAYASLNQYDKAIADYNKAIELNPKYPEVYNNRAKIYRAIGEIRKAKEDEKKASTL